MTPRPPACIVLLLLASITLLPAEVISTVAGGGPDGLPALQSNLFIPQSVLSDGQGGFYVSAGEQERIFHVDAEGTLTVFAGNGVRGFGGDGGPARDASFHTVRDMARDGAGNLYVVDGGYLALNLSGSGFETRGNLRVRRIDAVTGIIDTVAGGGEVHADGVPATSAYLDIPRGVDVDTAGNLYIGEWNSSRIRRVDLATGIITTLAVGLTEAEQIALDGAGHLYVASVFGIKRVDLLTGAVGTLAGPGGALRNVSGVAPAPGGGLTVCSLQRIWRVDTVTGSIETVAGDDVSGFSGDGGPAITARLARPGGLETLPDGSLLVADRLNMRVRRIDMGSGLITTVAGNGNSAHNGDGGPALEASIHLPAALALDPSGGLVLGSLPPEAGVIRRMDASGIIDRLSVTNSSAPAGALASAGRMAVARDGVVAIATYARPAPEPASDLLGFPGVLGLDPVTGDLSLLAGTGLRSGPLGDGGPATQALVQMPSDVAFDSQGNLVIAEWYGRIRRVERATGIITTLAGTGDFGFGGDGGPATSATMGYLGGLSFDPEGNLHFLDNWSRVRRIDSATGIITTVAGGGASTQDEIPALDAVLYGGFDLDIDRAGNIWILDANRLRKVDAATGRIHSVAGTGAFGFSGDGGEASLAALARPRAIAVNPFGSVLIADTESHRVRKVRACQHDAQPPSLTVHVTPSTLRPVNHRMVEVHVALDVHDDCPLPLVTLVSIESSDPDDAPGPRDGHTAGDIQGAEIGTQDTTFMLRAERSLDAPERTYTITYKAEDEAGHSALATAVVRVDGSRRILAQQESQPVRRP